MIPLGHSIQPHSDQVLKQLMNLSLSDISSDLSMTSVNQIEWGATKIWVKHEGENISGSFKDRAMKLIARHIEITKADKVFLKTSGNAGKALLTYLQSRSQVLIEYEAESSVISQLQTQYPQVTFLASTSFPSKLGQMIELSTALAHDWDRSWQWRWQSYYAFLLNQGYYLANPSIFTNCLGVLGYATISLELVKQLGQPPTHLISPVINSDNALGQWLGYYWLYRDGIIATIPELVLVEQQKRLPHFNYPNAWHMVKQISPVKTATVTLAQQYQAALELQANINLKVEEISAGALSVAKQLRDSGARLPVAILSGQNVA